MKLRNVLSNQIKEEGDQNSNHFVGQFSSIGSLGATPDAWLTGEFVASLAAEKRKTLKTPTLKLVKIGNKIKYDPF